VLRYRDMDRNPHRRLPTGYVVLQAITGKDRRGQPRRGVWLTLPIGTMRDLGWSPGDVVEVRRVGRHMELHYLPGDRQGEGGRREVLCERVE